MPPDPALCIGVDLVLRWDKVDSGSFYSAIFPESSQSLILS